MSIEPAGIGEACTNCGACCKLAICEIGAATLGLGLQEIDFGPCPALTQVGDKFFCGMIREPKKWAWQKQNSKDDLAAAFKLLIGSGAGCDYSENPTDAELALLVTKSKNYEALVGHLIIEAASVWFGRPKEKKETK